MGLPLPKAVEKNPSAFGSTKQTKILMLGLDSAIKNFSCLQTQTHH